MIEKRSTRNILRWKKSDRGSSHVRHGLDPRLRTNDEQSASARYIIIRERFRCIVFALYFFRMKLCQNVEKTTAIHLV